MILKWYHDSVLCASASKVKIGYNVLYQIIQIYLTFRSNNITKCKVGYGDFVLLFRD